MGPSHRVHLENCAISGASELETPVGNMKVDASTIETLMQTGLFDIMNQKVDEDEHSIEMHLPFLAYVLRNNPNVTVVPIMVGNLSSMAATQYAKIFQPYFDDASTLFVISR